VTIASVVGTNADPQELGSQCAELERAGIEVLPTNAEAARLAALLVKPELRAALLEDG
jgi:hypothetical protein